MSNELEFGRDIQGYNAYAPIPSSITFSATLVNGSAQPINIPQSSKKWIVSFSFQPGTNTFVDFTGATASIPAGATFAATTSELNPGARMLDAVFLNGSAATMSLITNNAVADVTVTFYAI